MLLIRIKHKIKNPSSSTSENNCAEPHDNNQVTCEVQDINASQEDSPEIYSQQHHHHLDGYTDAESTMNSAHFEGFGAQCEVQSASLITPVEEIRGPSKCDEMPVDLEITVKHEPLFAEFPETGNELLDNVKSDDPISGNFRSEMSGGTAAGCSEGDFNLFSGCSESCHGNTALPTSHQLQLSNVDPSGREVKEKDEPLLPMILVPKCEYLDDEKFESSMDYLDEPGNDMKESVEGTEHVHEYHHLDQCLSSRDSSCGNMKSSELPSSHQLLMQLSNADPSGRDVGEKDEPLLPVILVLKSEHLDDEKFEESIDDPDEPGNYTNEGAEETEHAHDDKHLDQCLSLDSSPLENDLATQQHSGMRPWCQESKTLPSGLQLREGPRAPKRQPSVEEPVLSDVGREEFSSSGNLSSDNPTRTRERPYSCDVCGASFAKRYNLISHNRTHTGERPFRCDVCGKTFVQASQLSNHKLTHTGERPYPCDICGKAFKQKRARDTHKRAHTGERPYPCDVCDMAFARPDALIMHMRKHTGERPHLCALCGKAFKVKQVLDQHMRTHTGERPFACGVCGKAFKQYQALYTHMRTHSGERPYRCDVCGKVFSVKAYLTCHMLTHTGERPFRCDVCGKEFSVKAGLARHMITHTGERPFRCDVCGKLFSEKVALARHMITHTGERPFRCDVCGRIFSVKAGLARHMIIHTGERPFRCDVCGKVFSEKVGLARHMITHTGERPFRCDVCGIAFPSLSTLNNHMLTHT